MSDQVTPPAPDREEPRVLWWDGPIGNGNYYHGDALRGGRTEGRWLPLPAWAAREAEVEEYRLRAERAESAQVEASKRDDPLKVEVAELRALLAECLPWIPDGQIVQGHDSDDLIRRIKVEETRHGR